MFQGRPHVMGNMWGLSTTNWHCQSIARDWTTARSAFAICLCRDWTLCCCSCWPSVPPEGNAGWRVRHSVLQGNWWNRSLDRYFQELISWSTSFRLPPIPRNALILSWWPQLQKTFVKRVLDCFEFPLHQSFMCWPSPTASLEQSFRAMWGVSWATVHMSSCSVVSGAPPSLPSYEL